MNASERWDHDLGAYDHVQATRPRTLSLALNDSPAGLAAWILEKWLTWSDPATRDRLSPDELLTNVMIYWLTQTIGSSMRFYVPATAPPLGPGEAITAPASVLIPHEPHLPVPPESWLRRAYPAMERYVVLEHGGHFLASEDPHRFAAEIRQDLPPAPQTVANVARLGRNVAGRSCPGLGRRRGRTPQPGAGIPVGLDQASSDPPTFTMPRVSPQAFLSRHPPTPCRRLRMAVVRPGDLGDWSAWLPVAQAAGACAW